VIENLNARIVRLLLAAAAVIIFLLGFLVCADVFGRAFLNSPVKGTPEIVSMSIVIICFLLAGYSVQSGSMISTDVFSGMFGVRGIGGAQVLSAIFGLIFFGLIVWGSYEPMVYSFASGEYEGEGALRVPTWPAKVIILLGSALVVVSYVLYGMRGLHALITGRSQAAEPPPASLV
jgi:TRAP-type mannitol/chloroaromatic compound transport system permease small subunit